MLRIVVQLSLVEAADPRAANANVGAAMALAALGAGAFFLLRGRFQVGNIVSDMPHPVVEGFGAGVG